MFTHWTSNSSQQLNLPYTILQPVIPGKQITIETHEEWAVHYYNKLIVVIIKAIDINNVIYCTDKQYWLITIHGVEDTLIHIVPSKTLTKHLLKQKDKLKSIKMGVHSIKQAMILSNGIYQHMTSNSMNK